jgi:hypothetical protein
VRIQNLLRLIRFDWRAHVDSVERIGTVDSSHRSLELSRHGIVVGPSSGFSPAGLLQYLQRRRDEGSLCIGSRRGQATPGGRRNHMSAVPSSGVLETLRRLIAIDTTSRNCNLELIGYVQTLLDDQVVPYRLTYDDEGRKANLLATLGPAQTSGGDVLSGHTDVVPVDDREWHSVNPPACGSWPRTRASAATAAEIIVFLRRLAREFIGDDPFDDEHDCPHTPRRTAVPLRRPPRSVAPSRDPGGCRTPHCCRA